MRPVLCNRASRKGVIFGGRNREPSLSRNLGREQTVVAYL